ncbi:effector binding domain-containing protein [Rossellomorea aquimaris]|uniref:GyrI-like domain-containing protein n=1 Tax=Rossellomorea aquimaris TaxID=189382 RepID=UPI001CD19549|nr:effector binding domain-containing protein [Rossellomorea aquimaris]MCA1060438.1 effector binding domain-containing protein [Rossellomorea aquimaris]
MPVEKMTKTFRVIGLKGEGAFAAFSTEVPKRAKQFLKRLHEVEAVTGPEIALYEPKKGSDNQEGIYYVGVTVDEALTTIPAGMLYIELNEDYATAKGTDIEHLQWDLNKWIKEQGHQRKTESYIVETYHPTEDGGEEVEVYLPIERA